MTQRPSLFFPHNTPVKHLKSVKHLKLKTQVKNKKIKINFAVSKTIHIFAIPNHNGTMAEWLGSGLQNRVQQFDSAWYLKEGDSIELPSFFWQSLFAPLLTLSHRSTFNTSPQHFQHLTLPT